MRRSTVGTSIEAGPSRFFRPSGGTLGGDRLGRFRLGRRLLEVRRVDDGQQVDRGDQRAAKQHDQVVGLVHLEHAEAEIPLADEAGERWSADHARAARVKAAIVHGMRRATPAISLTLWMPARLMSRPAHRNRVPFMNAWLAMCTSAPVVACWPSSATQDHVAHLADGRVGEPSLEVVLVDREHGGEDHRERRNSREKLGDPELGQQLDAEHVEQDARDAERAGRDHDAGQHRRERRWSGRVRVGHPSVQRQEGRLHAEAGDEAPEDDEQGVRPASAVSRPPAVSVCSPARKNVPITPSSTRLPPIRM